MDKGKANSKADIGPERKRLSSVATALQLLKSFSEEQVEIGISALARRLGVAKSTAHRLAATLVSEGMLEQDPETEKYRLGIALFRLGALVRRRMDVSNQARPYLYELREKTNETVHLAILDGTEIMYVYNLESTQAIRMRSDIGVRKPAYCTAEGQAILAFRPPEVIDQVIQRGLLPLTPQTITDPAKLLKALSVVRQRGCAIEDEESEIGMRSISAPIRNDAGEVVASVGVAGPATRLSKKAIAAFVPHVIETADLVSRRLGYRAADQARSAVSIDSI
ncbi:MAG: IclR family transcriptional regulator, regulon repressor [Alphaproteobacteria bacterium]|jgi:DNA-binding IclR family transcriptional regulator|nr:IclR family transcriptional regulator, regulon repressor [Alphaproteobacteria bacterium]